MEETTDKKTRGATRALPEENASKETNLHTPIVDFVVVREMFDQKILSTSK